MQGFLQPLHNLLEGEDAIRESTEIGLSAGRDRRERPRRYREQQQQHDVARKFGKRFRFEQSRTIFDKSITTGSAT